MANTLYTLEQKRQDDDRVYNIMRARTIQDAINYVGITDPPRNMQEYSDASKIFRMHIMRNQPNALNSRNTNGESLEVIPYVNARDAIYQWAYVSLLGVALRQNFQETVGCMIGVWETSCQFTDDLFAMGTKFAFAIGTTMLKIPEALPIVNNAAWKILGLYYGEKPAPRVLKHDYATHELNVDLFMLLQFLTSTKSENLEQELADKKVDLENFASEFDRKTSKQFKMQDWVRSKLVG